MRAGQFMYAGAAGTNDAARHDRNQYHSHNQGRSSSSPPSRLAPAATMLAGAVVAVIFASAVMTLAYHHDDDGSMPYEAFADTTLHKHIYDWGSYGIGQEGMFVHPQFADTDDQGNVYITDLGNKRVQKFDPYGTFITSWGGHGKADGQFTYPSGIAVDGNHVYVADRDLNRVQKFELDGTYISQLGGHGKGEGSMSMPNGVAAGYDGHVYVVDTGNHRVQKFTTEGEFVLSMGGSGTGEGKFVIPHDVDIAGDGTIYISDRGNKRIDHYAADGSYIKSHKFEAPGAFEFVPEGIEIASGHGSDADSTDVMMYVTNAHSKRVLYLNMSTSSEPTGTLDQFGPIRSKNIIFPTDVLLGADGQLYVVDMLGHKVHAFETPQYVAPPPWQQYGQEAEEPVQQQQQQEQPPAVDTIPPTVVAPPDITVDATGMMTAVDIGTAEASDQSGIRAILTNAPEQFPLGVSKVTWIAFDNNRNSAEAYQYITVLACGQTRHAYDHYMTGTMADDVINGTPGADLIFGHTGKDIINGGGGNDCIFGGGDDDVIDGGAGSDYMVGGTGNDILRGGDGTDVIYGGAGGDFLDGGDGKSDYCHQTDGLDLSVDCEYYTQE